MQFLHRVFIKTIEIEVAVAFIPLQYASPFQKTGYTLAYRVQNYCKLICGGGLVVVEGKIA